MRSGEQGRKEFLIKWADLLECENSWEPEDLLKEQFPTLILEDKDDVEGRGDDTNPLNTDGPIIAERPRFNQVYERRGRLGINTNSH